MEQPYTDRLRHSLRLNGNDEWFKRGIECARRILAAICFRETAESTRQQTGTVLFSPIGFYYSLFHIGLAALWMEHTTSTNELRRIKHATLQNIIKSKLVDTKLLSDDFLDLLKRLQELREYANYEFGKHWAEHEFQDLSAQFYSQTGEAFDQAIAFIEAVTAEMAATLGMKWVIQSAIGDSFGDNLIRAYLSPRDEARVRECLLAKHLTT
jgi:hypothetical protein